MLAKEEAIDWRALLLGAKIVRSSATLTYSVRIDGAAMKAAGADVRLKDGEEAVRSGGGMKKVSTMWSTPPLNVIS